MNIITKYRLKKLLKVKEDKPRTEIRQRIKLFLSPFKYSITYPLRALFLRFGNWVERQHKGSTLLIVLAILIFAFFVFNQLRYNYWLNIMHSSYPEEVLVALDKVLIEWNARVNASFFIMFNFLLAIMLGIINHRYNSDEVQTIPGTFKIK